MTLGEGPLDMESRGRFSPASFRVSLKVSLESVTWRKLRSELLPARAEIPPIPEPSAWESLSEVS